MTAHHFHGSTTRKPAKQVFGGVPYGRFSSGVA
jgi:hypothetical protein